jgi:Tfp pilus assembly protein PilO
VRLTERQLLILTVAAIVIFMIGGGVWLYFLYQEHQELNAELATLASQLAERDRKAKQNADLKTYFQSEAFVKEETALALYLPLESASDDTLLMSLNRMRKTTHPHLIPRRVEPVPPSGVDLFTPPPGVRKMLYRVELRGTFYDILEYLSEIENSERIMRIEHFSLKRRASTSGVEGAREVILCEATVRLMAFEFMQAAAPTAAR